MDVTEKRKSVRVPVDFPATFSHDSQTFSGQLLNLSVDGALLQAPSMLDPGQQIQLSFELPEHQLRLKSKVMWGGSVDDKVVMGVHFYDIPALHQAAIDMYIRNLLKM